MPRSDEASTAHARLKRDSARGAATTFASQATTTAVQLTTTVVLARLLTPEDYGIVAMVATAVGFVGLFRDLGLSTAAIQEGSLSQAQQTKLFWLNAGLGFLLSAVVAGVSPLVAWFYGRRELVAATAVAALQFIPNGAGAQFGASLIRELKFGRHAAANVAGTVATLATSVLLASAGHRYWAIVWGGLVGAAVTAALLGAFSPFRPGPPSRRTDVRKLVGLGSQVVSFDIVNYFARNADNVLIGRVWGSDALGLYTRAYALLMFPITSLRGPIMVVALPALSRLRDQPPVFRSYYCKITKLLALLSMPLVAFLFVASDVVIEVVLGDRWRGAARIFSYLALAAFIQPVWGLAGSLMLSLGQGARYFQCGVMNAVVVCAAFAIGVRWGAIGVAAAYSIGTYLGLYPNLWWALRDSPVRVRDLARSVAFPVLVSLAVGLATFVVRKQLGGAGAYVQLAALGVTYGATMLAVVFALPGGRSTRELIADVRAQFRTTKA